MATLEPNWETFRKLYPQFSSVVDYPEDVFVLMWENVTCIISDRSYGCPCRLGMLYLLLAHMLTLIQNGAREGDQGGFITSSSIDKVSVSKAAPPAPNMFHYWLGSTPWGQQLLVQLRACSAGGYYVGGNGELAAFRRVGGQFIPGMIIPR